MAISAQEQTDTVTLPSASHPLDPLTAEEIAEAMSILKAQRQLGPRVRVETIVLQEPDKDMVLDFQPGNHIQRNAFVVILDNDEAATYEAVVSLNERRVISWKHVPGVQPRVMFDEFSECEARSKSQPRIPSRSQETRHHRPQLGDGGSLVGGQLRVRGRGGEAVGAGPQFLALKPDGQRLRPPHRRPHRLGRP